MNRSESIEKLAEALATAQGLIEGAAKDAQNSHFRNAYATLASIWDACRGPLTSHGLSVLQTTRAGDGGGIILETTLLHTSGQWVSGEIPVNCDTRNPQAIGSALTYARRYGLAAMVGVCPDDDDDAEAATQDYRQQRNAQPQQQRSNAQRQNGQRPNSQQHNGRESRPASRPDNRPSQDPEDWHGYIADRAAEAQARWVKAMETANVDPANRAHPDFQMPTVHQANNHFVLHALKSGAIKQEDVAKDGKPGIRDAAKSKAALADLYRRAPGKVRSAVEAYLREKEQALRVKLGMDDMDDVAGVDIDAEEVAQAGREPGSDDE